MTNRCRKLSSTKRFEFYCVDHGNDYDAFEYFYLLIINFRASTTPENEAALCYELEFRSTLHWSSVFIRRLSIDGWPSRPACTGIAYVVAAATATTGNGRRKTFDGRRETLERIFGGVGSNVAGTFECNFTVGCAVNFTIDVSPMFGGTLDRYTVTVFADVGHGVRTTVHRKKRPRRMTRGLIA